MSGGYEAVTVAAIILLAAVSPGPDTAIVIRNSLTRSRLDGIATTLGIVLGTLVYVTMALYGLAAVIAGSASLFLALKYAGALYLTYVGVTMMLSKSAGDKAERREHANSSLSASFREGFFTNLSNPKFMLLLLGLFTQVISPDTPFLSRALYGFEVPIIALLWFSTISISVTTSIVRARVARILRHTEQISGAILLALGAKIIFETQK